MRYRLLLCSFLIFTAFFISIFSSHSNSAYTIQPNEYNNKLYGLQDTTITQTGDGEYDFGVDFGNVTSDLLETFVGIFWVGDGTGIFEILFNMIPIIGNNPSADDLLYPLFLILFTAGPYYGLKRAGIIE